MQNNSININRKRGYSVAEYSVFFVVVGVLFAAIIPILMRFSAHSRNSQRISDIKSITQNVQTFNSKNATFPGSLKELAAGGFEVPKDPNKKIYCTASPDYSEGDYQYFTCKNCDAIGPLKSYPMKYIVQVGALMERENRPGESNAGNRRAKYTLGDPTNCAANAIRGAGTLIEGVKGNRVGGTGSDVKSIATYAGQPDYAARYNSIISMERE